MIIKQTDTGYSFEIELEDRLEFEDSVDQEHLDHRKEQGTHIMHVNTHHLKRHDHDLSELDIVKQIALDLGIDEEFLVKAWNRQIK